MQKLKSFFLSKDILSFLLFLALSATFWFVHALGKERETTITIPVEYKGIPLNVAITNNPPTEININIKDLGYNLLEYSQGNQTPLVIDIKRAYKPNGDVVITQEQLMSRVNRYLHIHANTKVLEIHPYSILIQYQKLSVRTLPIELISKIEIASQFKLSDNIKLSPEYVKVYGPKHMIDSMKSVRTELIELKDLKDTLITTCTLQPIKLVHYSSKKIKLSLCIESFTERKVQIPITAINCPPNLSVKTFPAYVTATYTVGLSKFNLLNPNDIQVYLDYNDLKLNKLGKQSLIIKNNTSHISNIRISPQEVEFLLEQK